MKKLALLILLTLAVSPLYADVTIWYNGDFNGVNGLANVGGTNAFGTTIYTFDNFIVGQTATLTDAFSNNLMSFGTGTADVEIRSGVSFGNGGTLVYGAYGVAATQVATGRSGFGYNEYTITVQLPGITLTPGTYWLAVAPDSSNGGVSYVSTTSGANCIVGVIQPCGNDDNSFLNAPGAGYIFYNASAFVGYPADFSIGLSGQSTPEPGTLVMFGTGIVGLAGVVRRKLMV